MGWSLAVGGGRGILRVLRVRVSRGSRGCSGRDVRGSARFRPYAYRRFCSLSPGVARSEGFPTPNR